MKTKQFVILGILSLLAAIGLSSTLSYASAVTTDDVISIISKAQQGTITKDDIRTFESSILDSLPTTANAGSSSATDNSQSDLITKTDQRFCQQSSRWYT